MSSLTLTLGSPCLQRPAWPAVDGQLLALHQPCVAAAVWAGRLLAAGGPELAERISDAVEDGQGLLTPGVEEWLACLLARHQIPPPLRHGETADSYHGALLAFAARVLRWWGWTWSPDYYDEEAGGWVALPAEPRPDGSGLLPALLCGARHEIRAADAASLRPLPSSPSLDRDEEEGDDDCPLPDQAWAGLSPNARKILAVLKQAQPGDWLTCRQIGERAAIDATRELRRLNGQPCWESLVEASDGKPTRNHPRLYRLRRQPLPSALP